MIFAELDPLLHSQLRLAVMSILMSREKAEFLELKEMTGSTAGNLSVQLNKLKEAGYLTLKKTIKEKKSHTFCKITSEGIEAFEKYVENLLPYIDIKKE